MASRDASGTPHLTLPFDAAAATRLGWTLGDAITDDGTRTARLRRIGGTVRGAVHDVGGATVVLVRTPAGRERYYELPTHDVESALTAAVERGFRRVEDAPDAAHA
ncbi:hypothetical protein J2752_000725 [Halarchaeum rubridurum]|uniref:Uncharacterized protein n=1 Tax=Halarchaeum rubridurum TaxID=489911 RepID=A0A830FJ03_9EURY|nr:hypothetical protein [Halarchaeum rubridurum]MBP1953844.1 hypothetical protein [Halarchaeum rubridurum]GGM55240.1 hypothetical protein GCM10009017_01840 [Halarchaeum rubridurum]